MPACLGESVRRHSPDPQQRDALVELTAMEKFTLTLISRSPIDRPSISAQQLYMGRAAVALEEQIRGPLDVAARNVLTLAIDTPKLYKQCSNSDNFAL